MIHWKLHPKKKKNSLQIKVNYLQEFTGRYGPLFTKMEKRHADFFLSFHLLVTLNVVERPLKSSQVRYSGYELSNIILCPISGGAVTTETITYQNERVNINPHNCHSRCGRNFFYTLTNQNAEPNSATVYRTVITLLSTRFDWRMSEEGACPLTCLTMGHDHPQFVLRRGQQVVRLHVAQWDLTRVVKGQQQNSGYQTTQKRSHDQRIPLWRGRCHRAWSFYTSPPAGRKKFLNTISF